MRGANDDSNQQNGAIMVISTIICNIISLAAEAECGALFYNEKELKALKTTLIVYGIMRGTIKQKFTKAMDTHSYWVRDWVEQKNFEVKWKPGHMNLGDYFTKHYPPTHHRSMRQTYLVDTIIALQERILQGCAKARNLGSGEHGA